MKILVICQYYYPEPFRVNDICESLVRMGHSVSVVTGTPNYPMGEIYSGYERGKRSDEIINGVNVHRCKIIPRKTSVLNRLKNYFSYASKSTKYIKTLEGDFDVVLVNQLSPVMMAKAGIAYKKKHGKRMVLYCLDLWPDSLCVGGVKKGSLVYRLFEGISRKIYRSADKLLVTSKSFSEHLSQAFDIPTDRIDYLPQYAEEQFLNLLPKKTGEEFTLMFAGNIGAAQSIDTIIGAARMLKNENISFCILGDGSELFSLKEQAKDLPRVSFLGRKPLSEMPKYYEAADAMLITLKGDTVGNTTLPGKVQTYMAAAKPIVGAIDGETSDVLNEAQGGYCVPAEDAEALAKAIKALAASGEAEKIGLKNRDYYMKHFSKERFLERLVEHLS